MIKIQNKTKEPVVKKATVSGSYRDIENKLRGAINEKYRSDPMINKSDVSLWPVDIIPEQAINSGQVIIENYSLDKYFKLPFMVEADGKIVLGDSEEVEQSLTYMPSSQKDNAGFVFKDEKKRLVTGPVAIPGCKDCDFKRGEKVLTADEIEGMVHAYNTEFQLADEMHVYKGNNDEIIGKAVENWTLKEELKTTNVQGNEVTLPVGTWMATIKVSDDTAWSKVEDGTYQGFSAAYISRKDADSLLQLLNTADKSNFTDELNSALKRTLIADLEDPVPVSISLVTSPCVGDAIITSIKDDNSNDPTAQKAGRKISNNTLDKINKAFESAQSAFGELKNLITTAESERQVDNSDKSELEVLDMNKEDVQKMIEDEVKKAGVDLQKQVDDLTTENKDLKAQIAELKKGSTKEDPEKDEEIPESIKTELEAKDTEIAALKGRLGVVCEKLGIDPEATKLEGEDKDKDKETAYKGRDDRDVFGRKIKE